MASLNWAKHTLLIAARNYVIRHMNSLFEPCYNNNHNFVVNRKSFESNAEYRERDDQRIDINSVIHKIKYLAAVFNAVSLCFMSG